MRNTNRTTKRERDAVRRRLPAQCRRWGIAYTARASRTLTDAAIRIAWALDVPPGFIASADPAVNHWSATVPSPFTLALSYDVSADLFESPERRVRVEGFGGAATFDEHDLPVIFEPGSQGAILAYLEQRATGGDLIAPVGAPPFDNFEDGEYEGAAADE